MTDIKDTLAALSEGATPGEWGLGAYYVGTGPDERCGGMVEVDDFPNGIIDEEPATAERLSPNLEFIVALVNAYRSGQLVPVPSVEVVARALAQADGYDPDEIWEEFDRSAAATDMMWGGVPYHEIFPPCIRWTEYEHAASAVIAALAGEQ